MGAPKSAQNPFFGTHKEVRKLLCIFGCTLIGGMIFAGQVPPKKSAEKKPTDHSSFVCPDPEAKQACKSYQELLKARDEDLIDYSGSTTHYICFRKKVDEFFVVRFSNPDYKKHWDKDLEKMVPDRSSSEGLGEAYSYRNGVRDGTVLPSLFFLGLWSGIGLAPVSDSFRASSIDFEDVDKKDPNVGVSINSTQINVADKYKNSADTSTLYSLTIQRSTGRFVESFRAEAEKIPLLKNSGYSKGDWPK